VRVLEVSQVAVAAYTISVCRVFPFTSFANLKLTP
jgi:hypothetical protein